LDNSITAEAVTALDKFWVSFDSVLGLGDATVSIPTEVQALLDQRAEARKAKNFAKSDELRKAIESLGWKVKDTANGQEVTPS
jgi:cysteinyl-tRNA synthetase